jgi:hydrogenase maturation protease
LNDNLTSDKLTSGSDVIERGPSIVLIGYGNPLRSDDGIGWRIAQELRARLRGGVEVIECHELAPEMADKIRVATLVIFVDAATEGFPGEVRHHRLDGSGAQNGSAPFSHARTPREVMALAAELYGASPQAHLFTVSGSSFGIGETLSREVAQALPLVVAEIEILLSAAEHRTVAE